jgi:hypothetical protein
MRLDRFWTPSTPEFRDSSLSDGGPGAWSLESTHRFNAAPPKERKMFAILMSVSFFAPIAMAVLGNVSDVR